MVNKIKVQIYGTYESPVAIGCTSKTDKCSSCSSHGNDGNGKGLGCSGCDSGITSHNPTGDNENINTIGRAYENLTSFIKTTDVADKTDLEFIDISKIKLEEDSDIMSLIERGFEPPFTVIDKIVRFYGGLSKSSVYKDVKELLS